MGKASREKGARGERMFAALCREHGYADAHRTAQHCGKSGEAQDVTACLPGIHKEVKFVEKLNIHDALDQAIRDSLPGEKPAVFHKRSRDKWKVTMLFDDWIHLYREWHSGQVLGK